MVGNPTPPSRGAARRGRSLPRRSGRQPRQGARAGKLHGRPRRSTRSGPCGHAGGLEAYQGPAWGPLAARGGWLVGGAFLAFGGGQGSYAVAPEHIFQGFAGLVPDPARGAQGGVGDVADPAGRATSRTDLTVQDLHDVEDGDLLRRHGEAVSAVRAATALDDVGPPELAEDLL